MSAFINASPIFSRRPIVVPFRHPACDPQVPSASAAVKAPRKRRRRATSTAIAVKSAPAASKSARRVSSEAVVASEPVSEVTVEPVIAEEEAVLDAPAEPIEEERVRNLPVPLPDELQSHDLLSLSEEQDLLRRAKFLFDAEEAAKTLQLAPAGEDPRTGADLAVTTGVNRGNRAVKVPDATLASHLGMSEEELRRRRRDALRARNVLVVSNMRLVTSIATGVYRAVNQSPEMIRASKISGVERSESSGVTVSDLVQEGVVGLIRAAERYDPSHGVRFSSYAARAIQSACYRAATPANCIVSIPERLRRAAIRPAATSEEEAVARTKEYAPDHLVKLAKIHMSGGVYLDEPVHNSGSPSGDFRLPPSRKDLLPCDRMLPQGRTDQEALRDELRTMCYDLLTPRQANMVILRFGLHGKPPMEAIEIAKLYGLSESRINQVLLKAKTKLEENASLWAHEFDE